MNSLTVAYITSRREPRIRWFLDSLARQMPVDYKISIDVVLGPGHMGGYSEGRSNFASHPNVDVLWVEAKPTIWQGPHRITKADWWAKSNALNTAICLCRTDWIAFVDDRSVLCSGWLDCIHEAMMANEAVCGTYEKRANVKVENGVITDMGTELGLDHRSQVQQPQPTHDWYGGHCALPLEWCLQVNGYSEDLCDSLGLEDAMFGVTLKNSGLPMRYDPRMKIIEDRTQGEIDGALKRTDKGTSPNDKSHKIVEILRDKTTSQNSYDIRILRDQILAGEPFPPPFASHFDWYDDQPISEMI